MKLWIASPKYENGKGIATERAPTSSPKSSVKFVAPAIASHEFGARYARYGSAVNVASLFYLTPPTTALIAFFVFGEKLTLTVALGMAVAVSGVYLVARAK